MRYVAPVRLNPFQYQLDLKCPASQWSATHQTVRQTP